MILSFDSKQLEWRSCVHLAQDEVGIEEIFRGVDFHGDNQKRFNFPSGKEGRLIAKVFAFRWIFGGKNYHDDPDFMGVSKNPKYWEKIIEGMYEKYRGIRAFHTDLIRRVNETGQIVSPSGRIYKYKNNRWGNLPIEDIYNYTVQGHSHEIMGIVRWKFYELMMQDPNIEAKYVNSVYDSIVVDCSKKEVDKVIGFAKEAFASCQQEYEKLFGIPLLVPMECDVSVGENWGQMEEIDG